MNCLHCREKNNGLSRWYGVIFLGIFLLVSSCVSPRHLTPDYGKSFRECFSAQIINPDAPKDKTPVQGIPGSIAIRIYNDKYISGLTDAQSGNSGQILKGAGSRK